MAECICVESRWLNNESINFVNTNSIGVEVIADPSHTIGAKPTELLLMALASCSSYDVVGILQKGRCEISDVKCQVSAKRADSIPAVFTEIHLHFVITGKALKDSQVAKAIELSANKYCSIGIVLARGGVRLSHDYQLIDVSQ